MRVLISGIHGFIGANLSKYLKSKGHEVFGNGLGGWMTEFDDGNTFDIRRMEEIEAAIEYSNPDVFINTASRKGSDFCDKNIDDTFKSNILGTKNVIEACNFHRIPLIHFGTTAYYYSDEEDNEIIEESIKEPRTFYSATKLFQIQMVHQMSSVPNMIIEPVFLYGNIGEYASNRSESVPDIIARLQMSPEAGPISVRIDPKYIKDYTHIKDFCSIFEKIIISPKWGERLMIGAGYNTSLYHVAKTKIKRLERENKLIFLRDTDYKKHQKHDYTKLYTLYPEFKDYKWFSLKDFFIENGVI